MVITEKCGADTQSGNECNNPLGKYTDHVGEGRCVQHDEKVQGSVIDTFSVASINERMVHFQNDPNIFELDKEIVLSRALVEVISQYINEVKQEQADGIKVGDSKINIIALASAINQTNRTTAKLLETKNDIEVKRKYVIPIATLQYIISVIGSEINTHVKDDDVKEAIHNSLKKLSLAG